MSGLYDVIIAGAGPAGATAAYFLGEAGRLRLGVGERAAATLQDLWGRFVDRFPRETISLLTAHTKYVDLSKSRSLNGGYRRAPSPTW